MNYRRHIAQSFVISLITAGPRWTHDCSEFETSSSADTSRSSHISSSSPSSSNSVMCQLIIRTLGQDRAPSQRSLPAGVVSLTLWVPVWTVSLKEVTFDVKWWRSLNPLTQENTHAHRRDWMQRERSGLLSQGLIAHSH